MPGKKAIWTDKREKLLLLALDAGATEGEAQAAGLLLLQSWREAGIRGYDVLDGADTRYNQTAINNLHEEVMVLRQRLDRVQQILQLSHHRTAVLEAQNLQLRQQLEAAEGDAVDRPDYGRCVMPFGKYKGMALRDVPPDYLEWARGWITEDEGRSDRFGALVEYISKFLND
jgi:putative quorum-sensing-regulated virulence factor